MREIKFRMWNKKEQQMEQVLNMKLGSSWIVNGSSLWEEKDGILMQFTGLKDKNDTEIYEGDVLKRQSYNKGGRKNGSTYIEVKDIRNTLYKTANVFSKFEVVGS